MVKWYVKSGELEKIVIADNPEHACEIAIGLAQGEILHKHFFTVDEHGFRDYNNVNNPAEYIIKINDIVRTIGDD